MPPTNGGASSFNDIRQGLFPNASETQKNDLLAMVNYHIILCAQTGYFRVPIGGAGPDPIIGLSWEGHDRLEEIRSKQLSAFAIASDA